MATYLQGVTDYIPEFQPFQPDLNFYANVMQTKQTQYDTNWKALNKMYSQYYYADLTREDTTQKKESYLKNIEFQLKRVSQLDLSLEQNVTQATQVFKPFYEDKLLMKDMAWTKNKNNQLNKAEIFRNSTEDAQRGQYWEDGVRGVNYLTDEFKAASADEAMSFQNAEYVPYVDVNEKARKIAKDADLSIEKVEFSDGGKFIVKTKNGEALTEPLQKLFESSLGNDPGIQSMYKMKAYVDRKDYAYGNAAQFGGDKDKAEMKYLENSFNVLKEKSDLRYKQMQATNTVYENSIKDLETQIANGTASPNAKLMLAQYKMNKDINDKVLARAEAESKMLNGGQSSTATTTTGFVNPYGDIKSLRYKVDNGMASLLMQKDLDEAANILAYKDMEVDIEANPYKILEEKQKNSMQLLAAREASSMRLAKYKSDLKRQEDYEDHILETDQGYRDEKGNIVMYEDQNVVTTESEKTGETTDVVNMKNKSRDISNMTKQEYLDPYFKTSFEVLYKALDEGKVTKQKVGEILGYNKNKGITLDQFVSKYEKYGDSWLRKHVGSKGVRQIRNNMNDWIGENRELSLFTDNGAKTPLYQQYREANMKMHDYMLYIKGDEHFRKTSSKAVVTDLTRKGMENAKFLYDDKGELRSEKEYVLALAKNKAISNEDLGAYLKKVKKEKGENAYDAYKTTLAVMMGKGPDFFDYIEGAAKSAYAGINPAGYLAAKTGKLFEKSQDFDYNELVKEAGKSYSDAKVVKTPAFRIGSGPIDPGTGLSATGVSTIKVNPKGLTVGKAKFGEVVNDINAFDWNGDYDRVSVNGISKLAYDKAGNNYNALGKSVMDKIKEDMHKAKSSLSTFKLQVAPIAGGSGNLSAVIIKPNVEWIKANTATVNKDGKPTSPGLFRPDQADAILKNGISYVMSNKKMNSSMYKSSYQSPIEAYVDYFDKYEINSIGGDPMKSFQVTKNKLGTGDYIVKITYPVYNPEKGIFEKVPYQNTSGFKGEELTNMRDGLIYGFMDDVDMQNTLDYNNFEKVNQ